MRIGLYVCAFVFLMALSACPAPSDTCTADTDCTGGNICCKTGDAATKDKCVAKAACNTCEGGASACTSRNDCKNNEICTNGCCKTFEKKDCVKDSDCGVGAECIPEGVGQKCNICVLSCRSNSDCTGGTVCNEECCREAPCVSDASCTDNQKPRCDSSTEKCVPCLEDNDCPARQACREKSCRQVQCRVDNDCTDPQKPVCENYLCRAPIICKTDDDCARINPVGDLRRCDPTANEGRGQCKKTLCAPCSNNDECGRANDFCVDKDKGIKDGPRCLTSCESTNDCPQGFFCSPDKVDGAKVCYPQSDFCTDPCVGVACRPGEEVCVEGKCVALPKACDSCEEDKDCNIGATAANQCLPYGADGKFCGKACATPADCPQNDPKGGKYECLSGQCTSPRSCKP